MLKYVVGFAFSKDLKSVVLIHKNHGPEVVIGKWIGPGGKIEPEENSLTAIQREFAEETGLAIRNWFLFSVHLGKQSEIIMYWAVEDISSVKTMESEEVKIFEVHKLPTNLIHHAKWLIPLALDSGIQKPVHTFKKRK